MRPRDRIPSIPADSLVGGNAGALNKNGLLFYERCEALGPIVRVRVFLKTIYVVTGPELVEQILIKNPQPYIKAHVLRRLKLLFGDGLLTGEGEPWRHRRRLLQPLFHSKRLPAYAPILERNIAAMIARFRDGETRDVHLDVVDVCIRNLTETFFGVTSAELTQRIKDLASYCHVITQAMGTLRVPYYVTSEKLVQWRFGFLVRGKAKALLACIDALRTGRERESIADDFYGRIASGSDETGCPFGAQILKDEVITMLLAGHETAAAAVSWALQLLAQHPTVRLDLARELDEVCGDGPVTFADLPRLRLLERVLFETYRLYPPTHRIGRTVVEPVELGGVELRPGDDVNIPQWAIHRSPRLYDAPTAFRPERWNDDFIDRLPRCAFIPFSAGPRICIGQSVVTLEDALVLGNIVKAFDFDLAGPPMLPVEGLTLLPGERGSMPLVLRSRAARRPGFGRERIHDVERETA